MDSISSSQILTSILGFAVIDVTVNWENVADEVVFYLVILSAMIITQKIVDIFFERYFQKLHLRATAKGRKISKKRYDTLAHAFRGMASIAIWILAIFIVLAHYEVNYAALLTGAGAIGIFFGIAGKDIIMDLYVGFMALVEDQYRIGDIIWIDQDHSGTVEQINLRTVVLRDLDGNVHVLPHSMARAIINKTYDYSNVNIELGVAYNSDLDKVKELVNRVGQEMAQEESRKNDFIDPIKYSVLLRFDESAVTFRALGRVKAGKQWGIAGEYKLKIKQAFDENGIEIPFPQRVIRTINEEVPKSKKSKK